MSKNNRRPGIGSRYDATTPNAIDAIRFAPVTRDIRPRLGYRRCAKCKDKTPVKGGSITSGGTRFVCAGCKAAKEAAA